MQTTIPTQTEKTSDYDELLVASLILRDVNHLVRGIQTIVAVLLRYVVIGVSITDTLVGWMMPTAAMEYSKQE